MPSDVSHLCLPVTCGSMKWKEPTLLLLAQEGDSKSSPANVRGYSSLTQWVQAAGDWAKENLISQLLLAADPTPSCICSWKEQLMLPHVSEELRSYTGWLSPCWTSLLKHLQADATHFHPENAETSGIHISGDFGEDCLCNHLVLWHHGICYCSKKEANSNSSTVPNWRIKYHTKCLTFHRG